MLPTHKVIVKSIGPFKIKAIKAIRESIPNTGLKEAYDFTNTVMPAELIRGSKSFCRKIRKSLLNGDCKVSVERIKE